MYGLAIRLTGNPELAQEVLLDAFVAAWTGLPGFRGDSRFSTWVSSIAVNLAREAHRANSRRLRRIEILGALQAPGTEVSRVEDRIDMERAIAKLPAGAREALLLRHVHGLSCAETAAVLNITVGTVKSQTSRACALLRERLAHD